MGAKDPLPNDLYAATNALVDFGRDRPESLARALVVATERQYPILLAGVRAHRDKAVADLERQLVARPECVWPQDMDVNASAPERPTIEVGLTRQEFETKAKGDLAPVVLQLTNPASDAAPRVAVNWWKNRPGGETEVP